MYPPKEIEENKILKKKDIDTLLLRIAFVALWELKIEI